MLCKCRRAWNSIRKSPETSWSTTILLKVQPESTRSKSSRNNFEKLMLWEKKSHINNPIKLTCWSRFIMSLKFRGHAMLIILGMIRRCQGSVRCTRLCFHGDPNVLLGGVTLLGVWHVPEPTAYLLFPRFLFIALSGEPRSGWACGGYSWAMQPNPNLTIPSWFLRN